MQIPLFLSSSVTLKEFRWSYFLCIAYYYFCHSLS